MGKKSHKNGSGEGKSNAKAVVLKVAMHCECDGCVNKIRKGINKLSTLEGVEEVEAAGKKGEVKVVATADPEKLRRRLYKATGKHVDLVVLTKEVKDPTTTHTQASAAAQQPVQSLPFLYVQNYQDAWANQGWCPAPPAPPQPYPWAVPEYAYRPYPWGYPQAQGTNTTWHTQGY